MEKRLNQAIERMERNAAREPNAKFHFSFSFGYNTTETDVKDFLSRVKEHHFLLPQKIPMCLHFNIFPFNEDVQENKKVIDLFMDFLQSDNIEQLPYMEMLHLPSATPRGESYDDATAALAVSFIQAIACCGLQSLSLTFFNQVNGGQLTSFLEAAPQIEVLSVSALHNGPIEADRIQNLVDAMLALKNLKKFFVESFVFRDDDGFERLVNQFLRLDKLQIARLECDGGISHKSLPALTRLFADLPYSCDNLHLRLCDCSSLFSEAEPETVEQFFDTLESKGCSVVKWLELEQTGMSIAHLARLFRALGSMNGKLQPFVKVGENQIFDRDSSDSTNTEAFEQFVQSLPQMQINSLNIEDSKNPHLWSPERSMRLCQALHKNTHIWHFSLQLGCARPVQSESEDENSESEDEESLEPYMWGEHGYLRATLDKIFERNRSLTLVRKLTAATSKEKIPPGLWALALHQVERKGGYYGATPVYKMLRHILSLTSDLNFPSTGQKSIKRAAS